MRTRVLVATWVLLAVKAFAGGPLRVGGPNYGLDAVPFVWNPNIPIKYTVDAGPLSAMASGQTVVNHTVGLDRVQKAFEVWHNVPTAGIWFSYGGGIVNSGGQAAGDINTVAQYNDVAGTCKAGTQSPVIFDADGTLIKALGLDPDLIGYAAICKVNSATGYIEAARAVLNGTYQDGNQSNGELSTSDFNAAMTHEFGHFVGLGHSQINVSILDTHTCTDDLKAGLPLMFPFYVCEVRSDANGYAVLSADDAAWISKLYPNAETASRYGTISGVIYFSDGISAAQGVNVIARAVDDPNTPGDESLRVAVSAVSGYLFTGNPGQRVTGDNDNGDSDGSRSSKWVGYYEIPVPAGTYTVEIESVRSEFGGGSGVGPLDPPVPLFYPAVPEFWNKNESAFDIALARDPITVAPGQKVENADIIENDTPPRFDDYEDEGSALNMPPPPNLLLVKKGGLA